MTIAAFAMQSDPSSDSTLTPKQIADYSAASTKLFTKIALQIHQFLPLEGIFNTAVEGVREILQSDRVLICQCLPDGRGIVAAEAIRPGEPSILGQTLSNLISHFPLETDPQGRLSAGSDLDVGNFLFGAGLLPQFPVQTELVVPILGSPFLAGSDALCSTPEFWGLLVAHPGSTPHQGHSAQIELLQQLAVQVAIALQQSELYRQVQAQETQHQRLEVGLQNNSEMETEAERQQLQLQLQRSEERFRTSIENMLDCFGMYSAVRDDSGRIVDFLVEYLNAAACNSIGMTPEEQVGHRLCELMPTHCETELFEEYRRVVEVNQPLAKEFLSYEDTVTGRDLKRAIDVRATKLGDGFAAAWRDITHRKQVEEEISRSLEKEKELNQLKSSFVSMVSHEFRTPLSTILCSTELLMSYGYKWSEEKKLIRFHRIKDAVKRMSRLLNDVLLVGKNEAGKMRFNPVLLDLEKFCRDLVEDVQVGLESQRKILFKSQGVFNQVNLDPQLLSHILTNLLSNAIKYSSDDSQVQFDLLQQPEEVTFSIQDEGIGIPAADQVQLFQVFQRGSNVGNIAGTGLGLTLVKQCVDLHEGIIMFNSEIGRGTLFTVHLPLKQ